MNKTLISIIALCLILVTLLWLAFRSQQILEQGLPKRIMCDSRERALKLAGRDAIPILGTGSMVPYIPASPDPLNTIVAYAVCSNGGYDDIRPGSLCVYRPVWASPTGFVIHGAALKDSGGWIMSGLHNKQSESWARVTPSNFVGIVDRVYTW